MSFTQDNTNGYTDEQLVILNARLQAALADNGIEDEADDPDLYKHYSEQVLEKFDSELVADDSDEKLTQSDIDDNVRILIGNELYNKYNHLSYAEMAQVPELADYKDDILQAEKDWFECE